MFFFAKKKFITTAFVFVFFAGCCLHSLYAHSEDFKDLSCDQSHGSSCVQESPEGHVEAELAYYSDLFLELACQSPSGLQEELIGYAVKVSRNHGSSGNDAAKALLSEGVRLYGKVVKNYGHIHLTCNDKGLRLGDNQPPVSLAVTLPRSVIVELRNTTTQTIELLANEASQEDSRRISILPGTSRAIVKKIVVNEIVDRIALELDVSGRESKQNTVMLPVKALPPATLKGRIYDSDTGDIWPGRIYALSAYNQYCYDPKHADNKTLSEKLLLQFIPAKSLFYKLPFFYSDGTFELTVPAGRTKLTLERGFEHEVVEKELDLEPGQVMEMDLASGRIVDMKELGWISGDTHIHWVKNHWSENESLELLAMVQRAEDIRVVNNLTLLHRTADIAFIAPSHFPMGPIPGYCDSDYHMQMAEEYRNEEFYGHLCFLNIDRLILPISTGKGMAGPDAPDYPINKTAIEDCRSQGGISIEAHGLGLNWDVPVNVVNQLSDSLDQIPPQDYYRFLDCGFRLPLTNGSDHPARVAGSARAYVEIEGEFSYEKWIDGIRKRRTFTTSGPLVFLTVNGKGIGSELNAKPGEPLEVTAKVISRYPIGTFQIVSNSEVVAEKNAEGNTAELTFTLNADQPRWFVARCSQGQDFNAISSRNTAHTSAIYVNLDGKPVFKPQAAEFWARRMRDHAQDIAERGVFANDSQRDEAVGYIDDGAEWFERMISGNEDSSGAGKRSE